MGLNAVKNTDFRKKASKKLCVGSCGLKKSVCLKSYNVQKLEIRLTLGLNAAKNTDFMKKKFQIKVVRNRISSKKVCERIRLSPP